MIFYQVLKCLKTILNWSRLSRSKIWDTFVEKNWLILFLTLKRWLWLTRFTCVWQMAVLWQQLRPRFCRTLKYRGRHLSQPFFLLERPVNLDTIEDFWIIKKYLVGVKIKYTITQFVFWNDMRNHSIFLIEGAKILSHKHVKFQESSLTR